MRDPVVLWLRRDGDDGVVPEAVRSGLQRHPTDMITVAVLERFRDETVAQRESLEEHRVLGVRRELEIEE